MVMAAKLTRMTHKTSIQLDLVAESYNICSSRSRLPVRKLMDTLSYKPDVSSNTDMNAYIQKFVTIMPFHRLP
jgi:hypothetical protein